MKIRPSEFRPSLAGVPRWMAVGAARGTPVFLFAAQPASAIETGSLQAWSPGSFGIGVGLAALVGAGTLGLVRWRRRRAAGAAGRNAGLLNAVFDASADPHLVFAVSPDGGFRLAAWNAAAAAAFGGDDGRFGRDVSALLPASEGAAMRRDLAQAAATGTTVRSQIPADGSSAAPATETTCVPLRRPGTGPVDRVLVTRRDISHLAQAEPETLDANRRLVLAEQVAHIGHWHLHLASRVLTWSDEVYRIHGHEPQSFVPTIPGSIAACHPDDRRGMVRRIARALRRHEGFDIALRLVRPSGEVRDVLVRGLCLPERSGRDPSDGTQPEAIFGVFADIAELKQAERALAEKSALLEATLESMDQGLLRIDGTGHIPVINRRAIEILAISPEILATKPDYRILRQHLRETGTWGTLIQDPKHWHLDENRRTTELRSERRRADGRVIEIRSLPMLNGDGHLQTLTDITHRRHSDEQLRESEARYRLLADYTADLIVLDDASGRHLYISPAVTGMLGYDAVEANRLGLRTLVHHEDIANLSATLHALGPEQPTGSVIYRMRHKSGSDIWVEAAFRRIEEGGDVQIIQAIRDVSQRQSQEADLQRARVAAEAGARAKAEFLANMSHELRTPLVGILGVHDLLRGDAQLTPDQARLVGLAQESGRSLLTIVNDILDFSKIEAGQLVIESVPFSLRALVEACREFSAEIAQVRDVRFVTEIADDVPDWLLGDPTRLRQVILNLATNAIKFTPAGSVTLRVTWAPAPDDAPRPGATLRIALIDTGIGIAPETLSQIFERFAQADGSTSRQYGGTGLGLTICRRLVHLMGGEIGGESRLGEGSTFWFWLPLHRAAGADAAAAPTPTTLARRAGPSWRVLLAEDNAINQEIIGTVLRQKGHVVDVVDDGEQAVTAAFDRPRDLVLMDVQMPGQDGLAATQAIRLRERLEGRPRTPIIALTANAMPEEIERCRIAGMDAHVAKPVDWSVLFATMERLAGSAGGEHSAAGGETAGR